MILFKKNRIRSALTIGALFLLSMPSFAQKDVLELMPGSQVLKFDEETGIHRLLGNVCFKYQGNIMYCDSAHYHERKKLVFAYGHVHINKRDTLNLFCDSLQYNGSTKKATLWGHVRVRDSEYKLTTDTLYYDAGKSIASYRYGGKVESIVSQEVLTSRIAYFHPNSKNFFFSQKVHYKGKDLTMDTDTLQYIYSKNQAFFYGPTDIYTKDATMYCESGWYNVRTGDGSLQKNAWLKRNTEYIAGDTLLYKPDSGESIGKGHVFYQDTTQKVHFSGDYAFSSDSLAYAFITGHALAVQYLDDDTLYIHADTLYNFKKDSADYLLAYHHAKVYSTRMQGMADSLVYSSSEEKIKLYTNPILWSDAAEMKGRFMDVDLNDSTIRQVNIYDKATILMEVEEELFYNQIAGNDIVAYFKENELHRAYANGNAMTVFFPEDESSTDSTVVKKRMGMNRLYSSVLRIDIDSNELTGITYTENPDGVFYPMDKINRDEQFIPGFLWRAVLRPKSWEDLVHDDQPEAELPE